MSFMQGFGEAFSRGFEAQTDRIATKKRDDAAREDDLFKMKFQVALQNKATYDSQKREDAKVASHARRLAGENGLDVKATPYIAQMIADGMSEKEINDRLKNGKFDFSHVKPLAEVKPAIDTQTETALGQAMPTDSSQNQTGKVGSERPGFLKTLFGNGTGPVAPEQTIDQRVASTLGVPEKELYQSVPTDSPQAGAGDISFTPAPAERPMGNSLETYQTFLRAKQALVQNPNDPAAKAEYEAAQVDYNAARQLDSDQARNKALAESGNGDLLTTGRSYKVRDPETGKLIETKKVFQDPEVPMNEGFVDDKGNKITPQELQSMDEIDTNEIKQRDDIRHNMSTNKFYADYKASAGSFQEMGHSFAVMDDLVKSDDTLLKQMATGTISYVDSTIENAGALAEQFGSALQTLGSGKKLSAAEESYVDGAKEQAESIVQKWRGTQPAKVADKAMLFKAQQLLAGYQLGVVMGQEGRNVTEGERKAFMDAVVAGRDLSTFRQNTKLIMSGLGKTIDRKANDVMSLPEIKGFYGEHGYLPIEEIGGWQDLTKDDPDFQHLKAVTGLGGGGEVSSETSDNPATANEQTQQALADPEFDKSLRDQLKAAPIEERVKMIKEMRAEYDADHGAGSFDRNILLKGGQ